MNKIIIYTLLILSQITYSQHPFLGVVEYTIEPMESFNASKIADDKSYEPSKKREMVEIFSKPAYFTMEFNANESLYKSKVETMKSDAKQESKLNFLQTFGGGASGIYYSNFKEKLTLAQKISLGEQVLISYQFPEWELTTESKKIGEFLCYKAIKKQTNNKTKGLDVAWYSPEIPVQFGPTKYVGLPGLVLEVIAGKIRFTATKIQLNSQRL
jgi:GLPGLI family protein